MIPIIEKYINMVKKSKLKTAAFSLGVAAIFFITSFLKKDTGTGLTAEESMVVSLSSSLIIAVIWFISSLVFVKISDNIEERKAAERKAELVKRREKIEAKQNKKVNNKKKKKNKTVSE